MMFSFPFLFLLISWTFKVVRGSGCAGGSIPLLAPYETYPIGTDNSACIGGDGGSPFHFHQLGSPVQTLQVWVGGGAPNDGIKAIFVQFFDGTSYTAGSIPASGFTKSEFTFEQGETLQGQYILCGNGIGTRTGYIYFETSMGRTFQVGEEHTDYVFDSGNSFLMGLFGQSGSDIDQLGFYLMKPLQSVALTNVDYTNLGSLSTQKPQGFYVEDFCNSLNEPAQHTTTLTTQIGQSYTFTNDESYSLGLTYSVDAGVPEGPSVSLSASWTVSESQTRSQTMNTLTTTTSSDTATIAPRTFGKLFWSWWNNQIQVGYNGTMVYTFTDGSTWDQAVSGTYNGVYVSDVWYSTNSTAICPGGMCVGTDVTSCASSPTQESSCISHTSKGCSASSDCCDSKDKCILGSCTTTCIMPKKKCTASSDCCKNNKRNGCTDKGKMWQVRRPECHMQNVGGLLHWIDMQK